MSCKLNSESRGRRRQHYYGNISTPIERLYFIISEFVEKSLRGFLVYRGSMKRVVPAKPDHCM